MESTYLQIQKLDSEIERLSGVIKRAKKQQSDFGIALGFSGNQELRQEVLKLETKLRNKKKERLNKLETLHTLVGKEIRHVNNDLSFIADAVRFDGLVLENTSGL